MNQPEPFIDIHCHILPNLDDGPSNWDESLAMAEMAAADGVVTIIATPHQLGNFTHNSGEKILAQIAQFQQILERMGIKLKVLPGADVRIDPDLASMIQKGKVLTLANRRRHVLLELPHEVYIPLDRLLADLHKAGMVGILSHPERNQGILNQPNVLRDLVKQGCLFQVTAGSLLGSFGTKIQKFSESIIQQGFVDFIASDAHGTNTRSPVLSQAFDRVVELAGYDSAIEMFCHNPSCVVAGTSVTSHSATRYKSQNSFRKNHFLATARQFVHF